MRTLLLTFGILFLSPSLIYGQIQKKEQNFDLIYTEAHVPPYDLPRLLESEEGRVVQSAESWMQVRRPQILSLFSNLIYGRVPVAESPIQRSYAVEDTDASFMQGKATRKIVQISFSNARTSVDMKILVITPNQAKGSIPALMQLSFDRIASEKMSLNEEVPARLKNGVPIEQLISQGYAYVAVYHQDLVGHNEIEFREGIHQLFFKEGQSFPKANEWGVLAAISWSAMRVLDYLETVAGIDASRVALMGHSKLGKATLWAVAQDQRFAMAISAQSGCGGAALWRRKFGETLAKISIFPHWLCINARKFINHEHDLPVDQHMMLALIAPRALYVSSAADDHWADPRGEYLSTYHASQVYKLFDIQGFQSEVSPEAGKPRLAGNVGYHIRPGGHTVNAYDWSQYLDFMNLNLKK